MREAAKNGALARDGQVHWRHVDRAAGRVLLDGRRVAEREDIVKVELATRCPGKYAIVDMETGQIWVAHGPNDQLIRAHKDDVSTLMAAIARIGQTSQEK